MELLSAHFYIMNKIIQWLVLSSSDAAKLSLSVKGILLGIIPILITVTGITGIQIPNAETLTAVVELVGTFIQVALGIVSLVVTLIGVVRKILSTLQGTNAVLEARASGDLPY